MNKNTIWSEEQNKPSLVVDDLSGFAPSDIVYESLLRRGVFKWLSVRRGIIKLKNVWKERLKLASSIQEKSYGPQVNYWRGYRKSIEECRKEVRELCHSERWQAPDIDSRATAWLSSRGEK